MSLLLACARTDIDEEMEERIRSLAVNATDWEKLSELAFHHRVVPLLSRSLSSTILKDVPSDTLARLRRYYKGNVARNIYLFNELLEILTLLKAHEIEAIPFRGPIMAEIAYGDMSLRQYDDIDILVDSSDVLMVKDILISEAFDPEEYLSERQEEIHLRDNFHLEFNKNNEIHLEIHWRITPKAFGSYLDFETLELQEHKFPLNGHQVQILQPSHRLIASCLHATTHNWERLGWICDVNEIVRGFSTEDWGITLQKAKEHHCERFLFLGVNLANHLLDSPVPNHLNALIQADKALSSITDFLIDKLYQPQPQNFTATERYFTWVRLHKGLHRQIKAGIDLSIVPNTRDWEVIILPRSLSFLYLFLRPFRLWQKFPARHKQKTNIP
jgi:hypothetical protein